MVHKRISQIIGLFLAVCILFGQSTSVLADTVSETSAPAEAGDELSVFDDGELITEEVYELETSPEDISDPDSSLDLSEEELSDEAETEINAAEENLEDVEMSAMTSEEIEDEAAEASPEIQEEITEEISETDGESETDETLDDLLLPEAEAAADNDSILAILPEDEEVESHSTVQTGKMRLMAARASVPSKYDSRDLGILTAVKMQQPYSDCWAFAALACMETSLVRQGIAPLKVDLSELHLAYYGLNTGYDKLKNTLKDHASSDKSKEFDFLENGGTAIMAAIALSNWKGTTTDGLYPTSKDTAELNKLVNQMKPAKAYSDDRYYLDHVDMTPMTDTESVKKLIMEYGIGFISYYQHNKNFNYKTNSYYSPDSYGSQNHAVCVVGWDDNYSKDNFLTSAPGDGAWIIRNSWGEMDGENGYFYLSYYDQTLGKNASFFEAQDMDFKLNNYYYDGGVEAFTTLSGVRGLAQAFKLKARSSGKEQVEAVGFLTTSADVSYEIQIYENPKKSNKVVQSAESGTPLLSTPQTGTTTYAGYQRIEIDEKIPVKVGHTISVVIKFNKAITVYMDRTRTYVSRGTLIYDTVNETSFGESFILSGSRTEFADLKSVAPSGNTTLTPRMNVFTRTIPGSSSDSSDEPESSDSESISGEESYEYNDMNTYQDLEMETAAELGDALAEVKDDLLYSEEKPGAQAELTAIEQAALKGGSYGVPAGDDSKITTYGILSLSSIVLLFILDRVRKRTQY